jgi:CBS domain-containing protein
VTLQRIKQVPREQWPVTSIQRVVTPLEEVTVATPFEPLLEVLRRVRQGGETRVLVVHDGQVVGIVSPTDIARVLDRAPLRATEPGR